MGGRGQAARARRGEPPRLRFSLELEVAARVGAEEILGGLEDLGSGSSTYAARASSPVSSGAPPAAAISPARSVAVGGNLRRTAPCATCPRSEPGRGRRAAPEHELVTYCQGGVRAAHAALALRIAGFERVRIYDGSWAEWGNNPAAARRGPGRPGGREPDQTRDETNSSGGNDDDTNHHRDRSRPPERAARPSRGGVRRHRERRASGHRRPPRAVPGARRERTGERR